MESLPNRSLSAELRERTIAKLLAEVPATGIVKTWCRVCGMPALLTNLYLDYDLALRHFYALDDTPMAHKGVHAEVGGWGVHWRLDEVMATLFPGQHREECWPKPPWYEYHEAEDQAVLVLSDQDLKNVDRYVDKDRRMILATINRNPRDRQQLEELAGQVWDTQEVAKEFEILGFRAPFAIVRHRETGQMGSLLFQNYPRFYFGFDAHRVI